MHLSSHKFDQQNHTAASLVRPCNLRCENRSANRPASRETGLEMPCCPANDLLWVQITQSYPNRLRFSSLPCPQSPCQLAAQLASKSATLLHFVHRTLLECVQIQAFPRMLVLPCFKVGEIAKAGTATVNSAKSIFRIWPNPFLVPNPFLGFFSIFDIFTCLAERGPKTRAREGQNLN